ncbi:MAG TPA: CpaF/VirB11 family protein [Microlunatus sp.]
MTSPKRKPDPRPSTPLPDLSTVRSLRAVTVTSAPAPIFGQLATQPPVGRKPRLTSAVVRPLDFTDLDWSLVYRIRHTVSDRLSEETGQQLADGQIDEATRVQIGRDLIAHVVKKHSDEAILAGDRDNQIAASDLERYTRAVDSSIFGYGRWQPLLDDPHVENIEIRGYKAVFMVYADRILQVAPVADSDVELIEQLQFISAYSRTPKPFSPAHPVMTLNLEDRFRLHAEAFKCDRPTIVIRQHSFAGVSLDELRGLGMMPTSVFEFLQAAVRAKQSIVISGIGGVGKTTFLRALAMEMDPLESVGVVETDPELFLHKLPGRLRTVNFTASDGSGEGVGPDGRPIGEFTVQQHLMELLRQNISRIIVGEVRGNEAATMFQAMQVGAGSLSTIHAQHAAATIERLVTAAALGGGMTQIDAYRQIAVNINLIIHLGTEDRRTQTQGGTLRRYVNQVTEISGFRDSADGNGTTYMPATDLLYEAHTPGRPLDEKMSGQMREALYAQGWRP